jgi:hypothetical protein
MVSGFPYPTPPVARGKVGRPRLSRGPTARSKARQRDEDDDSDFDEGDDVEEGGSRAQGLGFSPTTQYVFHLSLSHSLLHPISLFLPCDLEVDTTRLSPNLSPPCVS